MSATPQDEQLFPILSAEQIDALRGYGEETEYPEGASLFVEGEPAPTLFVVLSGQVRVTRKAGRDTATLTVHQPGQFAGEMSMMVDGQKSIATGTAVGVTRALCLTAGAIGRAFQEHDDLKRVMLPAMAKRRPEADAQLLQREKMAALGKLSAGLAHELNNPAAAISRAAPQLAETITAQLAQSLCLGGCADGVDQAKQIVERLQDRLALSRQDQQTLSALERSDREEEMIEWLDARKVPDAWSHAADLVAAGIGEEELSRISALAQGASLTVVVGWVASAAASLSLTAQIAASSARLSEVIGAIKSYTYMDKAPVQQVDVAAGLESTLTLMSHKLRGVEIRRDYQPDLPAVTGRGGELNQVWTNLIDNAIDAMDGAGTLTLTARADDAHVVVSVGDTGSGIDAETNAHIFEPFYTTKPLGKGTGLGLDTVYHMVVDEHRGEVTVESQPGRTTFTVRLPIAAAVD